jgi:hypothetical protein
MTKESGTKVGQIKNDSTVSLELLSKMTGFPVELISQELFNEKKGEISVEDLRQAMLSYIDASLLMSKDK